MALKRSREKVFCRRRNKLPNQERIFEGSLPSLVSENWKVATWENSLKVTIFCRLREKALSEAFDSSSDLHTSCSSMKFNDDDRKVIRKYDLTFKLNLSTLNSPISHHKRKSHNYDSELLELRREISHYRWNIAIRVSKSHQRSHRIRSCLHSTKQVPGQWVYQAFGVHSTHFNEYQMSNTQSDTQLRCLVRSKSGKYW